jgi:hypothetical protein
MFLLARAWTGNAFAAALAGVAYAFGGLMLNSLMWPGTVPGLCWMPWLVWLAPLAWREGGRWLAWAAVVGALQMLSGAVEPVLMTWVVLAGLGAVDFLGGGFPRGRIFWRALVVGALVAGLSAAQLLPFFDLLQHSHRQGGYDAAATWPMPVWGWGSFLVPLFHAHASFHGVFLQRDQYWTYSYYAGLAVVGLAMWAGLRVRTARVWVLWGLAGFCLVLALGNATPVYGWCRDHLPVVGTMRFPVKFVILPVFVWPLLAAVAVAELRGAKAWLAVGWATGVAVLVVLWVNFRLPLRDDEWTPTWQNAVVRLGFLAGTILVGWQAGRVAGKVRWLWQVLCVVLVWLDGSHHAPQPQTVSRLVYSDELQRSLPQVELGRGRFFISREARKDLGSSFIPDVARDYLSRRFALASNCNLMEAVPKVDGFFPLQLQEFAWFTAVTLYGDEARSPAPAGVMDFLGVVRVSGTTNIFDWEARAGALPLLTAGQRVVYAGDVETLRVMQGTNFDSRSVVFLPLAKKSEMGERLRADVKISAERYAAAEISATVEASAPSVVVAAQTFYHPWHAYLDGQRVELLRANEAFQAVAVPAGAHQLKLVYEDEKFRVGLMVSGSAGLLCAGIFWSARKRRVA